MSTRWQQVRSLRRARPRSRFATASVLGLASYGLWAWLGPSLRARELLSERRLANGARFVREELVPRPLRSSEPDAGSLWTWLVEHLDAEAMQALGVTFAIATAASVLAACLATPLALLGARTLAAADPWMSSGRGLAPLRLALAGCARFLCVLLRAIPEYVLAFLLLSALGPSALPAVLAIALHNAGILGRLGAETVENLPPAPLRALRGLGASRSALTLRALWPLALPRALLYFFYRFETAAREASVLGMLGIVSIGSLVLEARARQREDEMLLYIALGGLLVLAVELASVLTRAWLRREGASGQEDRVGLTALEREHLAHGGGGDAH